MQYKLLSLVALAATASAQNLTSVLTSNPDLSNLTTYISLFPAVLSSLQTATNITILAPSNEAFAAFLNSSVGASLAANDTAAIQAVLTYHVLNGTYEATAVNSTAKFLPTLLTNPAYTNVTGGQRVEAITEGKNVTFFSGLLQNSTVTQANLNFTGGVIHIIDTVLTLPVNISATAIAAGLSAAAGALTDTNLVNAIDSAKDLTIFAPNNAAFQAIGSALSNMTTQELSTVLEYHVVNGTVGYSTTLTNGSQLTAMNGEKLSISVTNGSVFVNSAKVVTPDILVANGVLHVIDAVLNPNATTLAANPTATSQTVAFSGATAVSSEVPFTSGIPTPTSALGGGAAAGASSAASAASAGAKSTSSKAGAHAPMRTGAVGAAMLFAAGGAMMNV